MKNKSANPITPTHLDTGKPEITMAPLIDVSFLLLIFFMVTTVFPENRGLLIEKPESRVSEPLTMKKITFVISKTGTIKFHNQDIKVNDIENLIREKLATDPNTAVLIQIDKRASTDIFIQVLDASKAAGVDQVGIATDAIAVNKTIDERR